jgi:hypothetical protein
MVPELVDGARASPTRWIGALTIAGALLAIGTLVVIVAEA